MAEFSDKFLCKECLVKNSNNCDASTCSSALHHLHTPTHSQKCSVFIKTWQYSVALAPLLFQQQSPLRACRSSVASHVLISHWHRAIWRPFASVKIEGKNVCFARKKKRERRTCKSATTKEKVKTRYCRVCVLKHWDDMFTFPFGMLVMLREERPWGIENKTNMASTKDTSGPF